MFHLVRGNDANACVQNPSNPFQLQPVDSWPNQEIYAKHVGESGTYLGLLDIALFAYHSDLEIEVSFYEGGQWPGPGRRKEECEHPLFRSLTDILVGFVNIVGNVREDFHAFLPKKLGKDICHMVAEQTTKLRGQA